MKKLTIANLKKTIYYLKRNGLRSTLNAAKERLAETESYAPKAFSEEELTAMRKESEEMIREAEGKGVTAPFFHILVPAYRTDPKFLKELVESVQAQVYPRWELLILDASEDERVLQALLNVCAETKRISLAQDGEEAVAGGTVDEGDLNYEQPNYEQLIGKVRYLRLASNGGISENTNAGLPYVSGGYVGLLDHDDVLTPDALYEMAKAILTGAEADPKETKHENVRKGAADPKEAARGNARSGAATPVVLYSDEDKWDGESGYYEYHRKEDFNLDLLLSNNYICHFLVMKTEVFQELKLRKEYDGAQDYDLVLRAVARILEDGERPEEMICHVPKTLYHWRCHAASTAENPQSKRYAYEAGRRALQDFADRRGWQAKAEDLMHVGFYRLRFEGMEELFRERSDLGAVGGKIIKEKAIAGGRMAEDGSVYYEGLKESFSGYMHRAVLTQDAEAVDLRCIRVREEFWPLFEEVVGVPYRTRGASEQAGKAGLEGKAELEGKKAPGGMDFRGFDASTLPEGADAKELSIAFCKALREKGKRILWDPEWICRI